MHRRLNIFYAEDDPDDIALFGEGIAGIGPGHNLSIVNYGHEVLDRARTEVPDIIFLDYNLPNLDGAECLRLLKADRTVKHIPVVIYSTSSAKLAVDRCYARGAARYLIKPVDYMGLFYGLQYILDLFVGSKLVPTDRDNFVIDSYKRNG